jgi:chromosome partitioning protein
MFDPTQAREIDRSPMESASNRARDEKHPRVTLLDVCSRPRPNAHVIVFANEKGGVGKSTLAFHCSVALRNAGHNVAVVDLDRRQQSLSRVLANRDATARSLQIELPCPRHVVLQNQSGALLSQEISRIGTNCNYVVIDVAGHDSAIARYAMAMADTLVTPVNCSFIDLDLLGIFDPVTRKLREPGHFAQLVNELRNERARQGMEPLDWVIMKNRARRAEKKQQMRVDDALQQLMPEVGFRIGEGLSERVVYRELLPFGLTHLDLKLIPGLAKMQARTEEEVTRLIEDLALPQETEVSAKVPVPAMAKVRRASSEAFNASLHAHMKPDLSALAKAG